MATRKEEIKEDILEVNVVLKKILANPFFYIYQETSPSEEIPSTEQEIQIDTDVSEVLYSEEKRITEQFLRPIEIVLRPHISISQEILTRLYKAKQNKNLQKTIEHYGSDLIEKLESIRRFYRIFIESSVSSFLEEEANKLVKRFFGDQYSDNHKNFIKIKRFYEKLKSFHEVSSRLWHDISKLLETFLYMKETKNLVEGLQERFLTKIQLLIHQTETFLRILGKYIRISDISYQSSNFSYTINLTYDDNIDYTLEGLYESLTKPLESDILSVKESTSNFVKPKKTSITPKTTETIVIETSFRKFYKNNIYVYMLGSKDWNRTKEYFLELKKTDYEKSVRNFYKSILVILDEKSYEMSMQVYTSKKTPLTKEELDIIFTQYTMLMQDIFNEIYQKIVQEDFPGIPYPTIFFYHIGAGTFYKIVLEELKERKIGEILYLEDNIVLREYPANLIKKILIDWWNDLSGLLGIEEIDSYVIFSSQLEIILEDYLTDYQKVKEYYKANFSHISYMQYDEWFLQHYKQILGVRKFYIYKRFYPNLLFNLKEESIARL